MSQDESEEFPVLKDVVKRGDEDVIKTARLEKEIFEELDMLAPQFQRKPEQPETNSAQTPIELTDGNLPDAIENIIEHHTRAMRREIALLLENRLGLKP